MNLRLFLTSRFTPVRWGSTMKAGWSSNRYTTPTWEHVGNRKKSSPWVFVSVFGWVSWRLRKQRGLYPATAGTGFNAFTVQDHIWIMKVLKAVLCHSSLCGAWAALRESLLVNTCFLNWSCTVAHCLYSFFNKLSLMVVLSPEMITDQWMKIHDTV